MASSPKPVYCPDNEELALFMWNKKQERASDPKGFPDRIENTLYKAYCSVCNTKTPIQTLKEFSEIKGVGKWITRLMKGFFKKDDSDGSEAEELAEIGKKKAKVNRRYVPQKNSAAYALLITLYRETANGNDFMKKQELIDAAELSGLSRVPIASELGKGRQGQFAGSAKDWYSGWTSMKTLIEKGYVAKFSNPAKYKLLEEGREAAKECLSRSGLADSIDHFDTIGKLPSIDVRNASVSEHYGTIAAETTPCVDLSRQDTPLDIPNEFLEKITQMGYSMSQVRTAFAKVSQDLRSKDVSSLLPAVIHHLQKDQIDVLLSACRKTSDKDSPPTTNTDNVTRGKAGSFVEETCTVSKGGMQQGLDRLSSSNSGQSSFPVRACSSSDYSVHKSLNHDAVCTNIQVLMVPPLRLGERFEDVYDVILILDDREQFVKSNKGCRSRTVIEKTRTDFKIQVEVRRLPVGDAIWIARHKQLEKEYVLDFIVERKEVDDLRGSIKDNRYRDQKLRLLRCGIQKLIYIVEGDPNASEAAESIKTACFTTEILDGFDVQRTSGLGETLRKYGYLTLAITQHYRRSSDKIRNTKACPSFDDFIKECQDLEKMTVSDVFAIQLMQVPQVTEEIALAVVALYPTVISLAHAYSLLDGDIGKQEEMLMTQTNNLISRAASKNIFKLVAIPSKISFFFFWCTLLGRIQTIDQLRRRGMILNSECILCKQHTETAVHLFLKRSISQSIWIELVDFAIDIEDLLSIHYKGSTYEILYY